ncbi:MAG: hypothetical protein ACOY46_08285 [Bacillota bacterium]
MSKRVIFITSWILVMALAWGALIRPDPALACTVSCIGSQFGIATDPPESFLNMDNMAPGDRAADNLTVKNTGDHDFSYTVSASLQEGDQGFFNALLLDLSDSFGTVLYSGPISGLQNLDMGRIASRCQEVLTFSVTFPESSGNQLQNKRASLKFTFTARHDCDCHHTGAIFEHPVINRNFKLKIDSTVPIKFHLVRPGGGVDFQLHPDVMLEVSGPGPQGAPVTYTFRLSDGTLRFDSHFGHPHYIANFNTRLYPVQDQGWYTARVVERGAELGSISFQARRGSGTSRSNSP